MRIAMVTDSFLPWVGGLEWKVHYLATEYSRHGHKVTVFANRPYFTIRSISLPVEPEYTIVRCGFPVKGFSRFGIIKGIFVWSILYRHFFEKFDVIHCHHLGTPTQSGVAVKKILDIPVVATPCGIDIQMDPQINYGIRLNPRLDRIVRNNLKEIDVIGSISSSVRRDIEALGTKGRIEDIPNGVCWDLFQGGRSLLLRERLGISNDTLLVLSVGRNHIKKGYRYGIEAFSRLGQKYQNLHYALVGRNTTTFAGLVKELGMEGQISLVERVPMSEMPDIYHSADIFLNPSLIEGFAQVNVQAMASGLPCILTDAPGNSDAGEHGGALIAKSGDVVSLAASLEKLVNDKSLRDQLGKEAHRASGRYSWEKIGEKYLEVFQSLISKNNKI